MYTDFFGLTQRPFGSNAAGERVFVGPQQVKIISALGKALSGDDTVITLSGRIGTGKSTVINRVLESVSKNRAVARIGRLQLGPDEVLELLLTEFGVTELPPGTIQRYNAFKNLLKDWEQSGTRSFIVVEDAKHAGLDALLELEAITSSDAGDSPGACILLMGGLDLDDFLRSSQLDRLRQRLRRRMTLDPCSEAEVQGYLAHCFRVAGKDIDEILEPGAARMLYRLSEGIPRVINNICETALIAAPGHNMRRLTPKFLEIVALEVFGVVPKILEVDESETGAAADAGEQEKQPGARPGTATETPAGSAATDETEKSAEPSPKVAVSKKADRKVSPQAPGDKQGGAHQLVVESGFAPNVVHSSDAAKKAAAALNGESDDNETLDYDEIPEFIEDTLPSVKELSLPGQEIDAAEVAAPEPPVAAVGGFDDEIETTPQAREGGSADSGDGDAEPMSQAKFVDASDDSAAAASDDGEAQMHAASLVEDAPDVAAASSGSATNGAELDIDTTRPQKTLKLKDVDGGADQTTSRGVGKSFDPRNTVPDVENIPTLSDSMRVAVPQDAADEAAITHEAVQEQNLTPPAAVED
ncbi:MAG: hypothetical protein KJO31_08310, partial [Gammaproteobacteria bacterium]|nr:hypothetical protein [Gammaproteobacteria bacterium]